VLEIMMLRLLNLVPGELSLSCADLWLMGDHLWVNCPLQVQQPGQLSPSSFWGQ